MAVVNVGAPCVTLTTDFGLADNYAGIVKGVISGLNPKARIIDLSHEVPAFNILAGKYILESSYRYFPRGTIHLGVIDPGVGTDRKPIILETDDYFFIGPDNGLFSFLKNSEIKKIVFLNRRKYFLRNISSTFHARDIFSPIAGYLSLGVAPEEMGRPIKKIQRLEEKKVVKKGRWLIGSLVYIDHYGNLVSSIKGADFKKNATVYLNDIIIGTPMKTFASTAVGNPVCYINSAGYLEIGIREGSAAKHFRVNYGSGAKILVASE
jgi:S-adenosylmethionine hydrolase